MPEGDTIHNAANRIRPLLEGQVPDEIRPLHPRFGRDRWAERLAGRTVRSVDARGKHLFLRFEGGLTIHSHLRMSGWWQTGPVGARWRRAPRRAWLVLRRGDQEVVQFDGPVLELMTDSRTRLDQRIAALGPDVVAEAPFDDARFLRRLREDDPTRAIGDALLDQRLLAGLGTIWRGEACWHGEVDPWRTAADVSDDEALAVVHAVRPIMQASAAQGWSEKRINVYGRTGRPCPRCGTPVRTATQGDDNRLLYWCPGCQT
jgi:endonuclease-8